MSAWVRSLQQRIVDELESHEKTSDVRFKRDSWTRKEGGDGVSCVIQGGETYEKAGIGVSVIHGKLPPVAVTKMRADHGGKFDVRQTSRSYLPHSGTTASRCYPSLHAASA